jgi:uroporphyrinogen-III synthase
VAVVADRVGYGSPNALARAFRVRMGCAPRDWLAQQFDRAGAKVEFLAAYQRCAPALDPPALQLLAAAVADPASHVWLFSSSEAVVRLRAMAPGADRQA